MHKKRIWGLALMALLLICSGCSAAANKNEGASVAEYPAPSAAATSERATAQDSDAVNITATSIPDGQKIIYIYNASLRVDSPKEASDALQQEARRLGGYVEQANVSQIDDARTRASLVLRLPAGTAEAFEVFYQQQGEVIEASLNSTNVTDEYTDLESWLAHERAQEEQLLELMKRAQNIEETMVVREELREVQRNIETYEGRKRQIDKDASYSTFSLELMQKTVTVSDSGDPAVEGSLGDNIANAFSQSLRFLSDFGSVLLIGLSFIALPGVIAGAIIYLIIRLVRRRQKTRAATIPGPSQGTAE